MDRQTAGMLLENTFAGSFDLGRFSKFIKELLNEFTVFSPPKSWGVWKQYRDYIDSYQVLGTYKSGKQVIDVLVVRLKNSASIERARVMQRNFVAKYLGNANKDAALIAFYEDQSPDWRFSFVKMEYRLKEGSSGKVVTEKELTPAKRYSFLVGKTEPNHTCKKQFLELVMKEDESPTVEKIESAFSMEKVTKEFFNEYKELYLELKESLDNTVKRDGRVREEFEENGISSVDFSKKLLGQIVFIYFLQKKGWLGVRKSEKDGFQQWGSGPKNFLRKLFDKEIVPYDNFFNDILEPLFYEALATKRDDDYYSRFDCKIPFLNGGLFEPIEDYDWVGTDIILDNGIFAKILETFDRYNFTIKEDEPLEKEVAIDPEMLGKVFENLLEIKDRKSKGSYYTPREIVHYMCQQSLINYLETNTSIPREDIEKFIQFGEFTNSEDERHLTRIKEINEELSYFSDRSKELEEELKKHIEELSLPNSIIKNKERIDHLLRDVKIVDPAVGSGAFPVGMMMEIVKARSVLTTFFPEGDRKIRTDYNLKRETIENCLYGVDTDSSAVDIAKLRFWLSLIVDELDMKNIKPLPNLDHKIMVGNSLLEEFEGVKLFDEQLLGEPDKKNDFEIGWIDKEMKALYLELGEIHKGLKKSGNGRIKEIQKELKRLEKKKIELVSKTKDEGKQVTLQDVIRNGIKQSGVKLKELKRLQNIFFNEQNRELKKQYTEQINRIEWELIEETLKEQGNEEAMQKLKHYKKSRSKPFFLWKLYFAEVFHRENPGFDIVIANPPYAQVEKGIVDSIRYPFSEGKDVGKQNLYKLFIELSYNLSRKDGIATLIVQSSLLCDISSQYTRELLLTKTSINEFVEFPKKAETSEGQVFGSVLQGTCVFSFKKTIPDEHRQFSISINNDRTTVNKQIKEKIDQRVLLSIYPNGFFIPLIKPGEFNIINKLAKNMKLKHYIGYTKQGDLNLSTNKKLIVSYKTEIKFYRGKNIHRYLFDNNTDEYIDLSRDRKHKNRFYDLAKYNETINNMILMQQITGTLDKYRLHACIFSREKCLFGHSVRIIESRNIEPKVVLALLNSKFLDWFFRKTSTNNNVNGYEVEELPIPTLDVKYQNALIKFVDQILSITKDKHYSENPDKLAEINKLEKGIDKIIYNLYGLNTEEIRIVEGKQPLNNTN